MLSSLLSFLRSAWECIRGRPASRLHTILAILILALTLPAPSLAQQPPTPPPFDPDTIVAPASPPAASRGRAIYADSCAPCHGAEGNSDGPTVPGLPAPPPPFSDPATIWSRSPAEYFHTTKFGRIQNLMPPWQNQLSDEQIWQAVYYAWSLHTDAETIAAGEDLIAAAEIAEPNAPADARDFRDSATVIRLAPLEMVEALQKRFPTASQHWSDGEMAGAVDYIYTLTYAPPWESPYRPGAGVLTGQIVQGTADGDAVTDLPLTLTAYIDRQPAATFETVIDGEGRFQFEGLATSPDVFYVVDTIYKDVVYNSDVTQLSADGTVADVAIQVFETTDDPSGLFFSRANWVIDYEPGEMIVGQILAVGNDLDRAFVGRAVDGVDVSVTAELILPEGVTAVEFQDGVLGGRYHRVGQRIYDTAAVAPGAATSQIFMGYRLPYEGDGADFIQPFEYPISRMNFLTADLPGLEVDVAALNFVNTDTIQGVSYQLWSGGDLPGEPLAVKLTGLIPAGEADPRRLADQGNNTNRTLAPNVPPLGQTVPLAMGGALFVLLAGAFAWFGLQRRTIDPTQALQQQQDELILRIAQLDDRHAEGKLADVAWAQERAMLKSQLLDITGRLESERQKAL